MTDCAQDDGLVRVEFGSRLIHPQSDAPPANYAGEAASVSLALPSRLTRLGRGGIRTRTGYGFLRAAAIPPLQQKARFGRLLAAYCGQQSRRRSSGIARHFKSFSSRLLASLAPVVLTKCMPKRRSNWRSTRISGSSSPLQPSGRRASLGARFVERLAARTPLLRLISVTAALARRGCLSPRQCNPRRTKIAS